MTKIKIKFGDKYRVNEEIQKALERRLDNALNDAADYILTEADRIVRENSFDTGFLANSIYADKEQFLHKEIGAGAMYAPFIEYGFSAHWPPIDVIYNWVYRKRKDLNIKYSNKKTKLNNKEYNADILAVTWAIAKKMSKNGMEPKPFLRPAFNEGKSRIGEFLKKGMKKEKI